jgi:N-acetylmuramic acid 6-phosphate etherase
VTARAAPRWARLATEARNPRSMRLDALPTERIVALLLDEDRRALVAARRAKGAIARAARLLARTLESGSDVVFLGAGTSGRLGVLEAAECPPTFGTDPRRIRAVIAGGNASVFLGREGAEDRADLGRREGRRLRAGDLLVAVSASAVTPFVHGALGGARSRRAHTVLVTCAARAGAVRLADVTVALASGPEVLAGSTRLKAGSATKAALNALTTAAMVRLGKVYQNLMVDLRPTSAKLADRARRIVAIAAGLGPRAAARVLAGADGEVKTAIVMGRLGVSADVARARLARARDRLRHALEERPGRSRGRPQP